MEIIKGFLQRKMVVLLVAIVLVFLMLFNSGFFGGEDERTVVACVGDSLTYGSGVIKTRETDSYPAKLQQKLGTAYLVSNYGLRNATASLEGDLPYIKSDEYSDSIDSNPDIVIIMLGTNDTKTYNWDENAYLQGLTEIVESYKSLKTNPIIYLVRSPYCFSLDGGDIAEYDIQPSVVVGELGDIVQSVATKEDVNFIDLYTPTLGKDGLYTDGIHFNEEGYELIADIIYNEVK